MANQKKCKRCRGTGSLNHELRCPACNGTGRAPAPSQEVREYLKKQGKPATQRAVRNAEAELKMRAARTQTITTRNEEWGFYGTMLRTGEPATAESTQAAWNTAIDALVNDAKLTPEMARDFLDSRHGRHLADEVYSYQRGNVRAAIARFAQQIEFFRKNYRAADFGEI